MTMKAFRIKELQKMTKEEEEEEIDEEETRREHMKREKSILLLFLCRDNKNYRLAELENNRSSKQPRIVDCIH